jgi:hypothetical protein
VPRFFPASAPLAGKDFTSIGSGGRRKL